uniref:Uncharacterized protein n=1 Tax=Romanomermis culicivorax TaxID=13658 RepID=A0A915IC02_ROMCU
MKKSSHSLTFIHRKTQERLSSRSRNHYFTTMFETCNGVKNDSAISPRKQGIVIVENKPKTCRQKSPSKRGRLAFRWEMVIFEQQMITEFQLAAFYAINTQKLLLFEPFLDFTAKKGRLTSPKTSGLRYMYDGHINGVEAQPLPPLDGGLGGDLLNVVLDCSRVFTTSNGQVTTAPAVPPILKRKKIQNIKNTE